MDEDVVREAIRFSEDYGYNRWLEAQDEHNALKKKASMMREGARRSFDRITILYKMLEEQGLDELDIALEEDRRMEALGHKPSRHPEVRKRRAVEEDGWS